MKEIVDGDTIKVYPINNPEGDALPQPGGIHNTSEEEEEEEDPEQERADLEIGNVDGGDARTVRLIGCNTPESPKNDQCVIEYTIDGNQYENTVSKELYLKSIDYIREAIGSKIVDVRSNPNDQTDTYDRLLGVVCREGDDVSKSINLELIQNGLAAYLHRSEWEKEPSSVVDHDLFHAEMLKAKEKRLGMWAAGELADAGRVVFTATYITSSGKESISNVTVDIYDGENYLYASSASAERIWGIGSHVVTFQKSGLVTQEVTFDVPENPEHIIKVHATMKTTGTSESGESEEEKEDKNTGLLDVSAYKPEEFENTTAKVYVDGNYVGSTPKNGIELKDGSHDVKVTKDGYVDWTGTTEIAIGYRAAVTAYMYPDDGTEPGEDPNGIPTAEIDFMSSPTAAMIYIDGAYIGTTKKSKYPVEEGEHEIRMTKSGYLDATTTITVVAKTPQGVSLTLEKDGDYTPADPETGGEDPYFFIPPRQSSTYNTGSSETSYSGGSGGTTGSSEEKSEGDWDHFSEGLDVLVLNLCESSEQQTTVLKEAATFMKKHLDIPIHFERKAHKPIKLETKKRGRVALDDPEHLEEYIDMKQLDRQYNIICLLWSPGDKEPAYNGYTTTMDETLDDSIVCSIPVSGSKLTFAKSTGKLANERLKISTEGALTIVMQLTEAIEELYMDCRDDDADDLPDLSKKYCGRQYHNDRANAKCITNWIKQLNNNLPDDIKED